MYIILSYADWCGPCNQFKPVWKLIMDDVKKYSDIVAVSFESSDTELGKFKDIVTHARENIGFPTIIFQIDDTVHYYNEERTPEAIFGKIINIIQDMIKKN